MEFYIHAVTIYKGHLIRDTFMRLVKFMRKIRDRLVHRINFMAILDIFTLKLLENETVFWDTTVQNEENFLGQTSLKSTLSLINGNRVYTLHFIQETSNMITFLQQTILSTTP